MSTHHLLPPELPLPEALAPWLKKLDEHPGSCVVITIEHLATQNFPAVRLGWLSNDERKRVRRAMLGVNAERRKKNEPELNQIPLLT
jgi:hypothetical protein